VAVERTVNDPEPTAPDLPPGLRDRLDRLFRADPMARGLGAELVDWSPGRAEVRATPGAAQGSFLGPVHGGILFALADVAFSVANNSWGRVSVALSVDVDYVRAAEVGQELTITAVEHSRSHRISSHLARITHGQELLATLQHLGYRTDRWHFGEDAWPPSWRSRA
jgi:acyl-CoA thioesterase